MTVDVAQSHGLGHQIDARVAVLHECCDGCGVKQCCGAGKVLPSRRIGLELRAAALVHHTRQCQAECEGVRVVKHVHVDCIIVPVVLWCGTCLVT